MFSLRFRVAGLKDEGCDSEHLGAYLGSPWDGSRTAEGLAIQFRVFGGHGYSRSLEGPCNQIVYYTLA